MSLRRTFEPFSRYSLSPERYSRRVTRTSWYSIGRLRSSLSSTSETSAMPSGCLDADPAKMTSSGLRALTALADCSPSTHSTASLILDLPEPFGPTMTTMPGWSSVEVREAKDLKPTKSRRRRCKGETSMPGLRTGPPERGGAAVALGLFAVGVVDRLFVALF